MQLLKNIFGKRTNQTNNFIDKDTIAKADSAFNREEYNVSSALYSSAVYKLKKHKTNNKQTQLFVEQLKNKQRESNRLLELDKKQDPLQFNRWKLSKSSYLKAKQCPKYLFLDKNKKRERSAPSIKSKILFKKGHNFAEFKNVLDSGIEPSVIMGSQCKTPYRCDFVEYCKKD